MRGTSTLRAVWVPSICPTRPALALHDGRGLVKGRRQQRTCGPDYRLAPQPAACRQRSNQGSKGRGVAGKANQRLVEKGPSRQACPSSRILALLRVLCEQIGRGAAPGCRPLKPSRSAVT
eukprot:TRINITY_DN40262_c0_g1_i1.p2 TRINITY_DN40262_c0_g1~~TRINITY_DN40262_c0_g1_i1.p2  ORF type:complete len:120 (+),score=16.88 TRINITY_DN40262_c0_g1_i1:775-1134(+)